MPQTHTDLEPAFGDDFEDIESELFCSDREVTVGAFPALDRRSREAVIRMAASRPWAERSVPSGAR